MTTVNEDSEKLARWLLVLKHFNNNKPLSLEMTNSFEKYFEYYWKNDKNYAMLQDEDVSILSELPTDIQAKVFRDFLFQDFLEMFNVHFEFKKPPSLHAKNSMVQFYDWKDQMYS